MEDTNISDKARGKRPAIEDSEDDEVDSSKKPRLVTGADHEDSEEESDITKAVQASKDTYRQEQEARQLGGSSHGSGSGGGSSSGVDSNNTNVVSSTGVSRKSGCTKDNPHGDKSLYELADDAEHKMVVFEDSYEDISEMTREERRE